jgi:hypothetical protein
MFGKGFQAGRGACGFCAAFRGNLSESAHGLLLRVVCHNVAEGSKERGKSWSKTKQWSAAAAYARFPIVNRFFYGVKGQLMKLGLNPVYRQYPKPRNGP